MKRLKNHLLGIDQGEVELFTDFENDGDMWAGQGDRERRVAVSFSTPFRNAPSVQLSLSLYDMDSATNFRAELRADAITETDFGIVFGTWGDSRWARVRVNWMAIGELPSEDGWDGIDT